MHIKIILPLIVCLISFNLPAQNFWKTHGSQAKAFAAKSQKTLKPTFTSNSKNQMDVDFSGISQALLNIDSKTGFIDLDIPLPEGSFATYRFTESSIMQSGLATNYPNIKTFKAFDTSNANNNGRFDVNELGFHGMFKHEGELIYIDPEYIGSTTSYASYYVKDAKPIDTVYSDTILENDSNFSALLKAQPSNKASSSGNEKEYRLLVSASGTYTAYFGGTKSAALSAITTMVNRVNEIYQKDLGITLTLTSETSDYIYLDSNTDPYPDDGSSGDLTANYNATASIASTFDIGHLVTVSSGGVAYFGVCNDNYKARALTGRANPTGDAFYIDYVAHEMGHQFTANHTFNGTTSSCSGNRNSGTAYEPGSGSSIMAYAGICGSENLQSNSDPHFHAASINEISSYVNSGTGSTCGTTTASSNTPPVADAGSDFSIPTNTPFILTGSATDTDSGDQLIYTWEQYDLGNSSSGTSTMVDDGTRPIFRSWEGTTSTTRYLPRLSDVITSTTVIGESYPTTARSLNFRLTVRDQNNGTAYDDMTITVVKTTDTFGLTSPNNLNDWSNGNTETVSWNVATTDTSPISCPYVDILLSPTNDGNFSESLASNTLNDGTETITVPSTISSSSNVMLRCSDNRFYNVLNNQSSSNSSSSSSGSGSISWWMLMALLSIGILKFNSQSRLFCKK